MVSAVQLAALLEANLGGAAGGGRERGLEMLVSSPLPLTTDTATPSTHTPLTPPTAVKLEHTDLFVPIARDAVVRTYVAEPSEPGTATDNAQQYPLVMIHGFGTGFLQFYKVSEPQAYSELLSLCGII